MPVQYCVGKLALTRARYQSVRGPSDIIHPDVWRKQFVFGATSPCSPKRCTKRKIIGGCVDENHPRRNLPETVHLLNNVADRKWLLVNAANFRIIKSRDHSCPRLGARNRAKINVASGSAENMHAGKYAPAFDGIIPTH